jgi:hypothetical protein
VRNMALVILYHTTVKPESVGRLDEIRRGFDPIYEKHGIEVIGHWKKLDNPNESYYMVKYESEADYQHKIQSLHEDEKYVSLTAQLNSIRTDIISEKLIPT